MSVPNLPQASFKSIYASVTVRHTDNGLDYFCPNNIDTDNAVIDDANAHVYLPFRQALNIALPTASVLPVSTSEGGAPADPTKYHTARVNYRLDTDAKAVGVDLWWFATSTAGDTTREWPDNWHFGVADVGNVRTF